MSPAPVPFHVMAKPIGPICNLGCTYCFYLHKQDLLGEGTRGRWRMDEATLERFIQQYIEAQPTSEVSFAWQGGEPTLMGLDFFERVVALQKKHCPPGKQVTNALQTNCTLLDEAWAAFLKKHAFLVGISLDGPRPIHDHHRVDKAGGGSFDQVMRGRELLVKHGVPHNALVCVNRFNADHPLEVYRFFRQVGFQWVQFIPVVERRDFERHSPGTPLELEGYCSGEGSGSGGGELSLRVLSDSSRAAGLPPASGELVTPWSVRPEQFGQFLIAVFDEWVRQDVGRVYVQLFEECAAAWMGYGASLCVFQEECGLAMAIEHDGTVYSCDHYVYPDHRLGNLHEADLATLATSPAQQQFGRAKRAGLPGQCRRCEVRFMCHGACPKDRFLQTAEGEEGLNYLCAGYGAFFRHADPYLRRITALLRAGRPAREICRQLREEARPKPTVRRHPRKKASR